MDVLRVALALLLVLAGGLAGCVGGEDDVALPGGTTPPDGTAPPTPDETAELPVKMAERTNIEKALKAVEFVAPGDVNFARPNMTNRDWLLLSMPLSPEGTVHGFAWQIPEGAVIGADHGDEVVLDVAVALTPMGVPAGLPDDMDWALVAFHRHHDSETGNTGAFAGDHMYGVTKSRSVDGGSPQSIPPRAEPFTLRIGYEGLAVGDTVWFLLAARGPAGSEFAVGVRILGQEAISFPHNYSPTKDWDDFHGAVIRRPPLVPVRVVESTGLHIAYFHERHVILESSFNEHSADIVVDESLPTELYPHLTVRDLTLSSATQFGGWSVLNGLYSSGGEVGNFALTGDLHGTTFDLSGGFMNSQALPGLVSGRDTGIGALSRGSGSTPSSVEWSIMKSGTIVFEALDFVHVAIGVEVSALTGMEHLDAADVWGGVV